MNEAHPVSPPFGGWPFLLNVFPSLLWASRVNVHSCTMGLHRDGAHWALVVGCVDNDPCSCWQRCIPFPLLQGLYILVGQCRGTRDKSLCSEEQLGLKKQKDQCIQYICTMASDRLSLLPLHSSIFGWTVGHSAQYGWLSGHPWPWPWPRARSVCVQRAQTGCRASRGKMMCCWLSREGFVHICPLASHGETESQGHQSCPCGWLSLLVPREQRRIHLVTGKAEVTSSQLLGSPVQWGHDWTHLRNPQ